MLKNQEIIKLIETKEKAVEKQMEELLSLYTNEEFKDYRNFNNVFISSVKTLIAIINSNKHSTCSVPIGNITDGKYETMINGIKETESNLLKLTELNPQITSFINNIIDKLNSKSEEILNQCKEINEVSEDDNGIITVVKDKYIQYKYIQQIIDDYIRLLMY